MNAAKRISMPCSPPTALGIERPPPTATEHVTCTCTCRTRMHAGGERVHSVRSTFLPCTARQILGHMCMHIGQEVHTRPGGPRQARRHTIFPVCVQERSIVPCAIHLEVDTISACRQPQEDHVAEHVKVVEGGALQHETHQGRNPTMLVICHRQIDNAGKATQTSSY